MKKILSLILLLVLVACGSSDGDDSANDTTTTTTTSTSPSTTSANSSESTTTTAATIQYTFDVEKMSPFTGKELPPETWLNRPRRVIAFKIDNNINARPQSGLQEADAVHEILVEGRMTRFLAFFYDNTSKYLGPIRSARPTDPTVLRPLGGVLVASGATGGLIPEIVDMGVPVITDRRPDYFRISSRKAAHKLYADTSKLKSTAKTILNNYKIIKRINPSKNVIIGFGITKNTISNFKEANGLVVGSACCKVISNGIKKRQNPAKNLNIMLKDLKSRTI